MRPNPHTLGLAGVLLAMWYAGASQSNAAAYLIGFLSLSVACVSGLHAWSNLRGLTVVAEPITPVYEEEPIVVPVTARAQAGRHHIGVELTAPGSKAVVMIDEIHGDSPTRAGLLLPPKRRGGYCELQLLVRSTYPPRLFPAPP